ncbi:hypothetical protein LXL04_035867 [Taraxacum kok-saghyz]
MLSSVFRESSDQGADKVFSLQGADAVFSLQTLMLMKSSDPDLISSCCLDLVFSLRSSELEYLQNIFTLCNLTIRAIVKGHRGTNVQANLEETDISDEERGKNKA